MEFLSKNWKMLLLSSIALGLAGVCIFAPPASIAAGIIGLASSPVFEIFGLYAAHAATAAVALTAAAATFVAGALVNATANLFLSLMTTLFTTSKNAQKPSIPTASEHLNKENQLNSSSKLSLLGGKGLSIDTNAPKIDLTEELSPDSLRFRQLSLQRRKEEPEVVAIDSNFKLC